MWVATTCLFVRFVLLCLAVTNLSLFIYFLTSGILSDFDSAIMYASSLLFGSKETMVRKYRSYGAIADINVGGGWVTWDL